MVWIKAGFVGLGCIGLADLVLHLTPLWPWLGYPSPDVAQSVGMVFLPLAIGWIGIDLGWRVTKIIVPAYLLAVAAVRFPAARNFVSGAADWLELARNPDDFALIAGFVLHFLTLVFCAMALAGCMAWRFKSRAPAP